MERNNSYEAFNSFGSERRQYKVVDMPVALKEKFADQPEVLEDIQDRYNAAAYVNVFNSSYSVEAYIIVGSCAAGEGLRPGKAVQKPQSFVDLKRNFPSDVDILICIENDFYGNAQRQADANSRNLMLPLGYFVHAQVYDRDGLENMLESYGGNEWFRGLKELKDKLK